MKPAHNFTLITRLSINNGDEGEGVGAVEKNNNREKTALFPNFVPRLYFASDDDIYELLTCTCIYEYVGKLITRYFITTGQEKKAEGNKYVA